MGLHGKKGSGSLLITMSASEGPKTLQDRDSKPDLVNTFGIGIFDFSTKGLRPGWQGQVPARVGHNLYSEIALFNNLLSAIFAKAKNT